MWRWRPCFHTDILRLLWVFYDCERVCPDHGDSEEEKEEHFSTVLFQKIRTFMLVSLAWFFRVSGIMLLLFTILLYGCYGELYDIQQFIYFQF